MALRLAVDSAIHVGRPEEGLKSTTAWSSRGSRKTSPSSSGSVSVSYGPTSAIRGNISALPHTARWPNSISGPATLLEDGLLDASPIVRARAIEALGRGTRCAFASRRAMQDEIPSVRIAAMNVLSEAQITEIILM